MLRSKLVTAVLAKYNCEAMFLLQSYNVFLKYT